jgi:hypothetical protein
VSDDRWPELDARERAGLHLENSGTLSRRVAVIHGRFLVLRLIRRR